MQRSGIDTSNLFLCVCVCVSLSLSLARARACVSDVVIVVYLKYYHPIFLSYCLTYDSSTTTAGNFSCQLRLDDNKKKVTNDILEITVKYFVNAYSFTCAYFLFNWFCLFVLMLKIPVNNFNLPCQYVFNNHTRTEVVSIMARAKN